jgi:hypothetical protein
MKRVFEIDVLVCPHCGGRRKLIAFLTDGLVVREILTHLGPPWRPRVLAPARALPVQPGTWVTHLSGHMGDTSRAAGWAQGFRPQPVRRAA